MQPSDQEILLLKEYFGEQYAISNQEDVIKAQNMLIERLPQDFSRAPFREPLILQSIVKMDVAICSERSLLLQKLFLANNLKVRPVFVYWNHSNTSVIDLFKTGTQSHNIFEVKIDNKWYAVETTENKMSKLFALDSNDFNYYDEVPSHAKFIRHIFSRHGVFIFPSYIPDIY